MNIVTISTEREENPQIVLDTYSRRVFCVVAVKMFLIRYFFPRSVH